MAKPKKVVAVKKPKGITAKDVQLRWAEIKTQERDFMAEHGKSPTIAQLVELTGHNKGIIDRYREKYPKVKAAKAPPSKKERALKKQGEDASKEYNRLYHKINRNNKNYIYVAPTVFADLLGLTYGDMKLLTRKGYFSEKDSEGNIHLGAGLLDYRMRKKEGTPEQMSMAQIKRDIALVQLGRERATLVDRNLMGLLLRQAASAAGHYVASFRDTVAKKLPLELSKKERKEVLEVLDEELNGLKTQLSALPDIPNHDLFEKQLELGEKGKDE